MREGLALEEDSPSRRVQERTSCEKTRMNMFRIIFIMRVAVIMRVGVRMEERVGEWEAAG